MATAGQLKGSDVVKEGFLTKQAISSARNWKRRYFIFRSNALYYFEDQPKDAHTKPKGVFELKADSVVRKSAVHKENAFEIVSKPAVLRVQADSAIESRQWQTAIQQKINELKAARDAEEGGSSGVGQAMEGYLVKKAMKSGRNWKKRYFVLRNGRISYYEAKPKSSQEKPKGVMELSPDTTVIVIPDKQSSKKHTFEVTVGQLSLTVSASSKKEMSQWIQAIDQHVLIKSGLTDPGHLEVLTFLREASLHEYTRRLIDQGVDELRSLWDLAQRGIETEEVNSLTARLNMSTMEADRFKHALGPLKKTKKPKGRADRQESSRRGPAYSSVGLEPVRPPAMGASRLYAWGDCSHGQLGLVEARTGSTVKTPTYVDALQRKSAPAFVAAGDTVMAAITEGKEAHLYVWGAGPLGLGPDKLSTSRPFLVTKLRDTPIHTVAVGSSHVVAVTQNGNVYSWGGGEEGQLGLGKEKLGVGYPELLTTVGLSSSSGDPVVGCACAEFHTLLVTDRGSVYAMGSGAEGKLGLGDEENKFVPTLVQNIQGNRIGQVATGDAFSLAVTKSGNGCFWWGNVDGGPPESAMLVPNRVEKFTNRVISQCAAGGTTGAFLVGVAFDGNGEVELTSSVFTFGSDGFLLGIEDELPRAKPTLVERCEGHGVKQIAVSRTHSAAVTGDGRLLTWGKDNYGQLGSGYMVDVKAPMEAIRISRFRYDFVACGESISAAIASDDASVKEGDEEPGTPLSPPPPPEEVMKRAQVADEQLNTLLSQLGGLSATLSAHAGGDGSSSQAAEGEGADAVKPAPAPSPAPRQKKIGGKRILPPGSRELDNNWLEHTDPKNGKKYYENTETGAVQWTMPS